MEFLQYILHEVKNKRLPTADALDLIRQFKTYKASVHVRFLHPLVHHNTSDLLEQRFSSTFTGQEFFLADHVVQGQRVLPAVACLEMAREAIEQAAGALLEKLSGAEEQTGIRLKNVVWIRPIIVEKQPHQVHIRLFPEENDEISFEIYSESEPIPTPFQEGNADAESVVHSQGSAAFDSIAGVPSLDIKALQAQCSQGRLNSSQVYDTFRALGIDYGPRQQGIETVYVGDGQVLAKLSLPVSVAETHNQFVLHPSLMDSALQASIAFMSGSDVLRPILPFALQELEIHRHCPSSVWTLLRYKEGSTVKDNVQQLDIDVSDDKGMICVRMKGVSFRVLEGAVKPILNAGESNAGTQTSLPASERAEAPAFGTLMLRPDWKEQAVIQEVAAPHYAQYIVMLCEAADISHDRLERHIDGVRVLNVSSKQIDGSPDGIEKQFESSALQVFGELQRLVKTKPKGKTLIQIVMTMEGEDRLFSGFSGFLKTARLENPALIGQIIGVEPGEDAEGLIKKLKENSRCPDDQEIYYQNGKRCIAGWCEIDASQADVNAPWKERGVYLITGGAGGLGLIFAKDLAQHVDGATAILTGRSALSEEKQSQLQKLKASGLKVAYKQVDVADQQAVTNLAQSISVEYGGLNGIIHSAGVIRDNFILKKSQEEVRDVLTPKVEGVVNLDLASRDFNLDFFVLFSSAAGALGNLGQADYAAANAFLDAYAKYRNALVASKQRQGHTLSINWPLWKEGGMHLDEATEKMLMQGMGLAVLSTQTGILTFYQGLASGYDQVMVMEGDIQRIQQTVLSGLIFSGSTFEKATSDTTAESENDRLRDNVQALLMQTVSRLLNVKREDIEADTELDEYGFDPTTLTEFANTLNQNYQLDLTPTLFFEHLTLRSLAQYLTEEYQEVFAQRFQAESSKTPLPTPTPSQEGNIAVPAPVLSPSASLRVDSVEGIEEDLLREKAANYLKSLLSSVIKLPSHRIEVEVSLERYGIDSVMVMDLTNQLEETFGSLPKTLFFEYQSILELTGYFLESYRDQLIELLGIEKRTKAPVVPSQAPISVTTPAKPKLRRGSRFVLSRSESRKEKTSGSLDIAIIGLAGRYPQAGTLQEFWQNLREGKDCITEIPKNRWDHNLYFDENRNAPGKTYSKWGGFLEGVEFFDALFFNISPRDAEIIDPQERLFLECAFATLEDAGYTRQSLGTPGSPSLAGANVGVFAGVMYEEYQLYGAQSTIQGRPMALSGSPASVANRVSYFCNFHGPSMTVDTMCSSSLTTIHLACYSLQRGECEVALAGGVNASVHPNKYLLLGQSNFVSSKGRCESFGQGGDGYVPGEGVGAILLKPLAQAIADGDHIYGVIKATALNHGGKTNGYTVPNPNAQAGVIGRALKNTGIDPRTISYIEAHGTGTSLGDPIEIAGLTRAFREFTQDTQFCAIGSAKSNIGHCESAAGIAGVTKVLLQLQHQQLVPSLHSDTLNPHIDFSASPFVVQQELSAWERPVIEGREVPRRAGISSFGAGGSNAHVVIEEYNAQWKLEARSSAFETQHPAIIVLSAKNEERLREQATRLLAAIREQRFSDSDTSGVERSESPGMSLPPETPGDLSDNRGFTDFNLADMAYTLQVGREPLEERLAVIVRSASELEEKLAAFLDGQDGLEDLYQGQVKRHKDTLAAFAADDDMAHTIAAWIAKGKYAKLAEVWGNGLTVDWNVLYGENKPRRISLPTYPFARNRCWIPEIHQQEMLPVEEAVPVRRSPIVRKPVSSDRELEQRLREEILEASAALLKIHKHDLDPDEYLSAYGFDSISITSLSEQINTRYGLETTPELFFEHQTISSFIKYLSSEYQDRLKAYFNIETKQVSQEFLPVEQVTRPAKAQVLTRAISPAANMPIAIIGMSGILPQSKDLDAFWKHLKAGDDLITEVPKERWDWRKYYGDPMQEPNKTRVKYSGFIPDIDKFDPLFFGISPREAVLMDPQQRLFLECVWNTIADAGYKPSDLAGSQTGIFVGVGIADYARLIAERVPVIEAQTSTGNTFSILANRVSYLLDIHGPSEPVDTACSSSLVAILRGVEGIRNGTLEMAITGGVNAILKPDVTISLSKAQMLSVDGRCKTFDQSANGYVRGEGVGAILLKPLDRAIEDRDHIYAVIKGAAENHGGHTSSLTVPNPNAQAELLITAYEQAQVDPDTVSYIEVHGTGTPLGDPIEINGLKMAFTELYQRQGKTFPEEPHCGLASVKTNIGHLESAAGIAGVLKVLLSLKHKKIPQHLHLKELNPYVKLEGTPFYIAKEAREWEPLSDQEQNPIPRRAGVSSFGFGGVNAHVVLEEYMAPSELSEAPSQSPALIVLSARARENLVEYAGRISDYVESCNDSVESRLSLENIAYTLQNGREAMKERIAMIVGSVAEMAEGLRGYAEGKKDGGTIYEGSLKTDKARSGLVIEGPAGEAYLTSLIQENNLEKIAQLWIAGVDIDWELLYTDRAPSRISLPPYPFTRTRCWVPDAEEAETSSDGIYTYQVVWQEKDAGEGQSPLTGPILLLGGDAEFQEILGSRTGTGVILARSGQKYEEFGDSAYSFDFGAYEHYVKLFQTLKNKEQVPETIVYPLPVHTEDDASTSDILTFYSLINALLEAAITPNRIIVLYNLPEDRPQPFVEAVAGYARSLSPIWPQLAFTVLRNISPSGGSEALAETIVQEARAVEMGITNEILYREGKRYVKTATPVILRPTQSVPLKERGTYLITGGTGGLGMIFARYLAETYKAKLILTGRSPLNEKKEVQLETLTKAGGDVTYIQADVANLEDMQKVIETIKTTHGALNGVIHAAGISTGIAINQKSLAEFETTLRPKIQGTVILDSVTSEESLDFFCVFSSTSAIFGDFGQCDYAVANCFLNSYAEKRELLRERGERQGRTVSIEWPLWREGGIHLDEQVEMLYLQSSGLSYLETEDGIEAFEEIMASEYSPVMVIKGNQERIEQSLKIRERKIVKAALPVSSLERAKDTSSPTPGGESGLVHDLTQIASEIAGIPYEQLDVHENMGIYGFDSITLTEFGTKVGTTYGITLTPVVFFANSTIQALADHIETEFETQINAYYDQPSPPTPLPEGEGSLPPSPQPFAKVRGNFAPSPQPSAEGKGNLLPSPSGRGVGGEGRIEEDIAIIGAHGIFPGSRDLEEFWRNLETETDLITEIPKDRWDWRAYFGDPFKEKGKTNITQGGFISGIDKFDPLFFKISPGEAEMMDPQQRKFIEIVWKTIEDAGYKASKLSGRSVGVFVGVQYNDYQQAMRGHIDNVNNYTATGNVQSIVANRVSYLLNIHGPSVSIDTACSSSLIAVHQAVKAIKNNDCELAIAGGVSLMSSPETTITMSQLGVLSPDARCKTFDASANGYVRSEGVGAVFLKPLSKAIEDRDYIYGVIKATAVNHGGRASSLTAPNSDAQAALLVRAYEDAQTDPETITFIETHGTGTKLGDPVEIEGIKKAFKDIERLHNRPITQTAYCGLGAVKANVGHLEPAAGMAGIMKVLLAMKHKKLPGTPHLKNVNPLIELDETPFYLIKKTQDWKRLETEDGAPIPRRAGISSFGFGGTNAHIVLEEYEELGPVLSDVEGIKNASQIIVLSAGNEDRLKEYAGNLARGLDHNAFNNERHVQQKVVNDIIGEVSELLKISRDDIDPEENLEEYGFEPLLLTDLAQRIEERYQVKTDLTLLTSIESIAESIGHTGEQPDNTSPPAEMKHLLRSIAYTLQTGREAMEERLAVVVSGIAELKEKLLRFTKGEIEIENLYRGNIKGDMAESELPGEQEEKLHVFARQWVSGATIDWELLYPADKPYRMPLPTYPFAGKSYWAPKREPIESAVPDSATTMYYQGVWERTEFDPTDQTSVGDMLLFDTSEELHKAMRERFRTRIILVKPGEQYEKVSDEHYIINPTDADDYVRLIKGLKQDLLPPNIIYLWAQPDDGDLDEQLSAGLYSIFSLTQTLMEQRTKTVRLLYIYRAEPGKAIPAHHGGMSGFANTVRLENPHYVYKTVAVSDLNDVVEIIATEFRRSERTDIRYENGIRYRRKWEALEAGSPKKQIALRDNGVYLITGGAGGIGLILAEYLADQVQARIILTGRSELSPGKSVRIEAIKSKGSEVLYLQSDLSNREDVARLIHEITARYHGLHGIVHSAGVIRDAYILKKTKEEIRDVIAAKVYGTVYLDEETRGENLDFFVLFSSGAGIIGNQGQSDYAYANRFMDYYAEKRTAEGQRGKTISIAWPLWRSGGMEITPEKEAYLRAKTGMEPLPTQQGMTAWRKATLALSIPHCMVIYGQSKQVEQSFKALYDTPELEELPVEYDEQAVKTGRSGGEKLLTRLEEDITRITSETLKLSPDELDSKENLGLYGFDSMSYTQYAQAISDAYNIELLPVVFYENSTIHDLAEHISREFEAEIMAYYPEIEQANAENSPPGPLSYEERGRDGGFAAPPSGSPSLRKRGGQGVSFSAAPVEERIVYRESVSEDIAIIGMHGIFPGSKDPEEFWRNLESETDLITEIPEERWDWREYYGDPSKEKNKTNAKWGGFIPDADKFDPAFFNISAPEAEMMDPQQRLFLQVAWKAIEDAGYKASDLWGAQASVFVGVQFSDYQKLISSQVKVASNYIGTGNAHTMIANRLSFLLNLRGPSEAIDTACSSSLIAIHQAVKSLRTGETEIAIAGGVSLMFTPEITIGISQLGILSPTGRCKTFDKSANGYVRGEGIGALLLKPLSKAIADGDNIQAVIKGTAANHGGRASSLVSPNSEAQTALLVKAYQEARIGPETISFIEAHGTGTALGDPVEIEGIKRAFKELERKQGRKITKTGYCGLGSVKTNIGHLEPAAGIAGIIKLVLSMKHKTLPGTPHLKTMNPYIRLKKTPFYIVENTQAWERLEDEEGRTIPRRAGVSSFGFGGTNAHVVLEEYEHPELSLEAGDGGEQIVVLSAKNQERLKEYARATVDWLNSDEIMLYSLKEIAYTSQIGREAMDERISVVVTSHKELREKLQRYAKGEQKIQNLYRGNVKEQKETYAPLLAGEAGEAFIRVILQKKELGKLAQLWVLTGDINWQSLYQGQHPRRVSLPTYPFARERYWIQEPEKESEPVEKPSLNLEHTKELKSLPEEEWSSLSESQRQRSIKHLKKELNLEKEFADVEKPLSSVRYAGELKRLPEKEWSLLSEVQRRSSLRNLEKEFNLRLS